LEIGETIKYYRKQKRLTQAQMADLAYTDNCHISRIEKGRKTPSVPMVQGIASVLGIPAWVLLYGKISSSALEFLSLLEDCTENEQAELCSNLTAMKVSMRRFR